MGTLTFDHGISEILTGSTGDAAAAVDSAIRGVMSSYCDWKYVKYAKTGLAYIEKCLQTKMLQMCPKYADFRKYAKRNSSNSNSEAILRRSNSKYARFVFSGPKYTNPVALRWVTNLFVQINVGTTEAFATQNGLLGSR